MPISAKQIEIRKKFIGSSDAAAVLGLDPYRTPFDVWADKTGRIEATGLDPNNDAIDVGNWCEEAVLKWFANKRGLKLILNDENDRNRRQHANGIMAANFDAFVEGDVSQACEAKTHAVTSLYVSDQWGEEGTEEIPERVALQCQHQMAVVPSLGIVHVPVLLGGVGLRAYFSERNDELIRDMTDVMLNFWHEYVLKDSPPPDAVPSLSTVKKLRRVPNKIISLADDLVTNWIGAKETLKAAEEHKEDTILRLLRALGDAEAGSCALGIVTYYLSKPRLAYTVPAHPGFRSLRLSKPKG